MEQLRRRELSGYLKGNKEARKLLDKSIDFYGDSLTFWRCRGRRSSTIFTFDEEQALTGVPVLLATKGDGVAAALTHQLLHVSLTVEGHHSITRSGFGLSYAAHVTDVLPVRDDVEHALFLDQFVAAGFARSEFDGQPRLSLDDLSHKLEQMSASRRRLFYRTWYFRAEIDRYLGLALPSSGDDCMALLSEEDADFELFAASIRRWISGIAGQTPEREIERFNALLSLLGWRPVHTCELSRGANGRIVSSLWPWEQ